MRAAVRSPGDGAVLWRAGQDFTTRSFAHLSASAAIRVTRCQGADCGARPLRYNGMRTGELAHAG